MTGGKMSRRNWWVRNGCARAGSSNWLVNACSMGSKGASAGAKAAAATTPVTMIAPATKLECANSRRHERAARRRDVRKATVPAEGLSLVPEPRVQTDAEHVEKQIGRYQNGGGDEEQPLHPKGGPRPHDGCG